MTAGDVLIALAVVALAIVLAGEALLRHWLRRRDVQRAATVHRLRPRPRPRAPTTSRTPR